MPRKKHHRLIPVDFQASCIYSVFIANYSIHSFFSNHIGMDAMKKTILIIAFLILGCFGASAEEFNNPYHQKRLWKVWRLDSSPVNIGDGNTLTAPARELRLFPRDVPAAGNPEIFLRYQPGPDPQGKYAGIWDDVYSNHDNRHSFIRDAWSDARGNALSGLTKSIIHTIGGNPYEIGANFTSQSTTGMGHEITNNAQAMARIEQLFYFADVLVSGPAHISYMEHQKEGAKDEYQALQSIFFNSIGSSGSETIALTKMVIAGGYLDPELKTRLKVNGLYPSAMLYIWKAGLPYDAPFGHELRHRVAYFSLGDGSSYAGKGNTSPKYAREAYYYNDSEHMRNMIDIARSLQAPPPEALLTVVTDEGCTPVYYLKKTVLVHQKPFKTAKLRVSLEDSFDLDGRPLTFRLELLNGDRRTTITQVGDKPVFDISVPFNLKLPKGRTSIAAIANNGLTDGNPAIINVYRPEGKPNKRPIMQPLPDTNAKPGQKVTLQLKARDPDFSPVTFHKVLGPGRVKDDEYTWTVPKDHPGGVETVVITASDGTSGNSYAAENATIAVSP